MVLALNKDKIARCFLRARESYDREAKVQEELRQELCDLLAGAGGIDFSRVLEIGCCTGGLTELLCSRYHPEKLYVNDLVEEFAEVVADRLEPGCMGAFEPLFGDIEQIQLPDRLSLVVSSATFQWLVNLDTFLDNVARALAPKGMLAFSLFTPGTLAEFREITGVGLNYRGRDEIRGLLEERFTVVEEKQIDSVLYFKSASDILHHLRATGVGGVSEHHWSKKGLLRFEELYETRFREKQGLPVSYAACCYLAVRRDGEN